MQAPHLIQQILPLPPFLQKRAFASPYFFRICVSSHGMPSSVGNMLADLVVGGGPSIEALSQSVRQSQRLQWDGGVGGWEPPVGQVVSTHRTGTHPGKTFTNRL